MLPDLARQRLFGKAQLIGLLQIHPELSGGVEERSQTHGGISGDASLPFDNRRDPIRRHSEGLGESIGVNRRI